LVSLLVFFPAAAQAEWTNPVRVSDDLVDSSAAIGVADDGTTTVIWTTPSGPNPGQAIRLARISPSGTVGTPIDVVRADSRLKIHEPALGVGADGAAVVAWSDYTTNPSRVSAVRISPNNQMGSVQTIATPAWKNQPVAGLKVVVDPAGTATVVWYRDTADGSTSVAEAVRLPATGPAEPPRVLGSTYGHLYPSIAAQRDGRVLVAWSAMYDRPQFTTISAAGTQGPVQNLSGEPGTQTDIATALNGQATVTWMRGSDNSLHARQIDSSGALGPDVQLSATGEQVAQYRLGLTTSGVTTALWTDRTDLRIAHLQADGSAVPPRTISTAPIGYSSIELALSVDNANHAQGTWIGSDNRIRARRIPFGAALEPTRVLSPPSSSLTRNPMSVTAPSGVGTTMWLDSSSGTQQLYVAPASSGVSDGPSPPPPPTPTPTPTPSCPTIKLVGLRGTDDNDGPPGLGKVVGAFGKALQDNGVLGPFATIPIAYGAVPVNKDIFDRPTYDESVAGGIDILASVLTNDPCIRKSRYVLAGYSQGAQVIGDAIEKGRLNGIKERIAATVLFGDPKFDSSMTDVAFKSTFSNYPIAHGVISGRAKRNLFAGYRMRSFCRFRDVVCQRDLPRFFAGDFRAHEQYSGTEAPWAAALITNQILDQPKLRRTKPEIVASLIGDKIRVTCRLAGSGTCQMNVFPSFRYVGITGGVRPGTADDKYRFIDHRSSAGVTEHTFTSPFITHGTRGRYKLTVRVEATALQDGMLEYHENLSTTFNVP
jgi:hypothetical protein